MKTILYFTAAWCGPCKALAPRMEKLSGQIKYQKIDIDGNHDMSAKYGIRNVPTLVLIDEKGEPISKMVGVRSDEEILNWFNG